MKYLVVVFSVLVVAGCGPKVLEPDEAAECDRCEDWNEPIDPFRVHGNTWYIGTDGLSSFLIETNDGFVLVDGGLSQSAALIDANMRSLGFDPLEIKAILVSHMHYDHAGGVNAFQRLTGAPVYTSPAGLATATTGQLQEDDPQYDAETPRGGFPAIKNVIAVDDGGTVTVGDVEITAVHTPGHTPGGVSWTWESCALNSCYKVVYADSLTSVSRPGFSFAESGAAAVITESAGRIADLECDILLSPHPFFFGMYDKLERIDEGNPFINQFSCVFYAEEALGWLEQRLDAERM